MLNFCLATAAALTAPNTNPLLPGPFASLNTSPPLLAVDSGKPVKLTTTWTQDDTTALFLFRSFG